MLRVWHLIQALSQGSFIFLLFPPLVCKMISSSAKGLHSGGDSRSGLTLTAMKFTCTIFFCKCSLREFGSLPREDEFKTNLPPQDCKCEWVWVSVSEWMWVWVSECECECECEWEWDWVWVWVWVRPKDAFCNPVVPFAIKMYFLFEVLDNVGCH